MPKEYFCSFIAGFSKQIIRSKIWNRFLDVVFRQDQSRYRNRIGARNLAAMCKIALNAFSREISVKGGIATRQFAAVVNPVYRERVFKNLF